MSMASVIGNTSVSSLACNRRPLSICLTVTLHSYIWNASRGAKRYVGLTFGKFSASPSLCSKILYLPAHPNYICSEPHPTVLGVFFLELAEILLAIRAGNEIPKMRIYVGHDGTIIRLISGLGLGRQGSLRWPAFGSEVSIEVCLMRYARPNGTVVRRLTLCFKTWESMPPKTEAEASEWSACASLPLFSPKHNDAQETLCDGTAPISNTLLVSSEEISLIYETFYGFRKSVCG